MEYGLSVTEQVQSLAERVRAYLDAKENERAARVVLDSLGPEILGWLLGVFQEDDLAREVYSAFQADLPQELWAFDRHAPFRAWAYGVARKVAFRHLRSPSKQDLPIGASLPPPKPGSRHETSTWAKTEISSTTFTRLREQLTPEERMILILRVDRQMTWEDVARVMENPSTAETLRESAGRLRRYFHRVRDRLRQLAVAEGLVPSDH